MPDLETSPIRPGVAGDVGGDDADVGLSGADQARTVRSDDPGAPVSGVRREDHRVVYGDSLRDDDGEADPRVGGLGDRRSGGGRRDEDDGDVGAGGLDALAHRAEDGDGHPVEVDWQSGLAGVDAADDACLRGEHAPGVLHAFGASHALDEYFALRGEENGHLRLPGR